LVPKKQEVVLMTFDFKTCALATIPAERRAHVHVGWTKKRQKANGKAAMSARVPLWLKAVKGKPTKLFQNGLVPGLVFRKMSYFCPQFFAGQKVEAIGKLVPTCRISHVVDKIGSCEGNLSDCCPRNKLKPARQNGAVGVSVLPRFYILYWPASLKV
jgi:hypothetical protein